MARRTIVYSALYLCAFVVNMSLNNSTNNEAASISTPETKESPLNIEMTNYGLPKTKQPLAYYTSVTLPSRNLRRSSIKLSNSVEESEIQKEASYRRQSFQVTSTMGKPVNLYFKVDNPNDYLAGFQIFSQAEFTLAKKTDLKKSQHQETDIYYSKEMNEKSKWVKLLEKAEILDSNTEQLLGPVLITPSSHGEFHAEFFMKSNNKIFLHYDIKIIANAAKFEVVQDPISVIQNHDSYTYEFLVKNVGNEKGVLKNISLSSSKSSSAYLSLQDVEDAEIEPLEFVTFKINVKRDFAVVRHEMEIQFELNSKLHSSTLLIEIEPLEDKGFNYTIALILGAILATIFSNRTQKKLIKVSSRKTKETSTNIAKNNECIIVKEAEVNNSESIEKLAIVDDTKINSSIIDSHSTDDSESSDEFAAINAMIDSTRNAGDDIYIEESVEVEEDNYLDSYKLKGIFSFHQPLDS